MSPISLSSPVASGAVLLPRAALPKVPATVVFIVPVRALVASSAAIVPILALLAISTLAAAAPVVLISILVVVLALGASLIVFNSLRLCQEVPKGRGLCGFFIDLYKILQL